jgi:bacterioferritin-associated ferredoxin
MIVCHCRGVSDRTVRQAVRRGATTPRAVARACGAGSGCGGCLPLVAELIAECLREEPRPGARAVETNAPPVGAT